MQAVKLLPVAHLFVCGNRREAGSSLGEGCAERGDAIYDALKHEVEQRALTRTVWVTRTHCLGICPKLGATVALYPHGNIWVRTEPGDAAALVDAALVVPAPKP